METVIKKRQDFLSKTLAIGIFLSCFALNSFANNAELRISPLRFAGVHALNAEGGQNHGYMVVHSAKGDNWNFNLYDNKLKETKDGTIATPRYAFFNQLVSNGEYTLVNFLVNAFSQSINYYLIDSKGNQVASVSRENPSLLRRGDQFFPNLYNHPSQGFIVTESKGGARRSSYVVEHLDYKLNTLWSTEIPNSRGNTHVYELTSLGNRIYIVEASERMGKTHNTRLHCLDASTGELKFTFELTDQNHAYFPTALRPLDDGSIALTGTYFNGDKIRGKKTRGLFFMSVSENGVQKGLSQYPWKELRSLLRTKVIPIWFFKIMPDVWVHGLEVNDDGSFTAIAELYRYSGETTRMEDDKVAEKYHRIRILDFMVFDFNASGEMVSADRIEKPHQVLKFDSEFSGSSNSLAHDAGQGPLKRGRAMKRAGAFGYRFHQKVGETNLNLGFATYEYKKHHAYLMDLKCDNKSIKTEMSHAKPKLLSYLEIVDLCVNQSGFGFILTELSTRSFDDSEAYWRGVLPSSNGTMMIYEYMPLTGKLVMNIVEM